jgi:hypothetical protein
VSAKTGEAIANSSNKKSRNDVTDFMLTMKACLVWDEALVENIAELQMNPQRDQMPARVAKAALSRDAFAILRNMNR